MIQALSLIVVIIASVYYFILEGKREAHYYHYKNLAGDIENDRGEHIMFTRQRIQFFCVVFLSLIVTQPKIITAISLAGIACLFMFLHDGKYYATRDNLAKGTYPNGWLSMTKKSNSWLDRKGFTSLNIRLSLFYIGILILAVSLIIPIIQI